MNKIKLKRKNRTNYNKQETNFLIHIKGVLSLILLTIFSSIFSLK